MEASQSQNKCSFSYFESIQVNAKLHILIIKLCPFSSDFAVILVGA